MAPYMESPRDRSTNGRTISDEGDVAQATSLNQPMLSENDAAAISTDAKRYPTTGLNVLIVGAGAGGLTAAIECWRKGHTVVNILERSSEPVYTGDVLTIGPSAMLIFRHWQRISQEIEAEQYDCETSYKKHSGEHIFGPSPPSFNDPEHLEGRIGPHVGFVQGRAKFYKSLLRQTERLGMKVTYGQKVRDYFEDECEGKGGVVTEEGKVYIADIVIAADGIRTRSGKIVAGEHLQPRESGTAIYRSSYPIEEAMKEPLVRERWPRTPGQKPGWEFWIGQGVHSAICISNDMVCWGLTHPDDGSARESWDPDTAPEEVLSVMEHKAPGWHAAVPALIRTAPCGSIVHWKIMWRDLRRAWTSPGGRVVQIGDAAHSFLPSSGNGATQALEDATSLAAALQLAGRSNAALGTKVFNTLRYQRISCAQKMGFVNAQTKHMTDWAAIEADPIKIRTRFPQWVFKHDAEAYVYERFGQALDHIVSGAAFENTNIPPGHVFKPWTMDEVKADLKRGKRVDECLDGDWS